jgi:hypothetical protein
MELSPTIFTVASTLWVSSAGGTTASASVSRVVSSPTRATNFGDRSAAGYADHLRSRFLALDAEHGREKNPVRNEVRNDSHTYQHIVRASNVGPRLPQEHKQNTGEQLW